MGLRLLISISETTRTRRLHRMDNTMSRIGPQLRTPPSRAMSLQSVVPFEQAVIAARPTQWVAFAAFGLDLAMCVAAPLLAALLVPDGPDGAMLARLTLLATLLTLAAASAVGAYHPAILFRGAEQVRVVLRAAAMTLVVVALAVILLAEPARVPWPWSGGAAALLLAGLATGRLAVAWGMAGARGRRFAQRTVIVGSGLAGTRLLRLLQQLYERSLQILGIVDDQDDAAPMALDGVRRLGQVAEIFALVRRGAVDTVVLALPWSQEQRILELTTFLADYPVHVRLAPDLI